MKERDRSTPCTSPSRNKDVVVIEPTSRAIGLRIDSMANDVWCQRISTR